MAISCQPGYLALRADVGICRLYPWPMSRCRGATFPKTRDLEVHFGPFLSIDFCVTDCWLSGQGVLALCSAFDPRIVENLRTCLTRALTGERAGA